MDKPNFFLISLGKRIVRCRKELKMSQENLAEAVDLSVQSISAAECGKKALRPENLLKISRVLGVSTDYLLTGEINESDLPVFAKKLKNLSPKQIMVFEKIIDNCIELTETDNNNNNN